MLALPELSAIHDRYLAVSWLARERLGGSLAGKLLLCTGYDADTLATLLAAGVAGAASLCVEADGERLRQGLRLGLCDFVVGVLDEALRILKNEVRRGRAVSVGVITAPESCLAEIMERGLQPDLLGLPFLQPAAERLLTERGALLVSAAPEPQPAAARVQWSVGRDAVRSLPQISILAAELLDPGCHDTPDRLRWLERGPRALGRAFHLSQCLRMTDSERAIFLARVRAEIPSATVTVDGQPLPESSA